MAFSKHQTVNDYVDARKAGDAARCAEIVHDVMSRWSTRTTDGTEAADLYRANTTVPLAAPAD
jgi:hypothetical protein